MSKIKLLLNSEASLSTVLLPMQNLYCLPVFRFRKWCHLHPVIQSRKPTHPLFFLTPHPNPCLGSLILPTSNSNAALLSCSTTINSYWTTTRAFWAFSLVPLWSHSKLISTQQPDTSSEIVNRIAAPLPLKALSWFPTALGIKYKLLTRS